MKKKWILLVILGLAVLQMGMGRRSDQYDEEARETEQQEKIQKADEPKPSAVQRLAEAKIVEEPEAGTDDTTKIKFKIPGT